MAYQFTAANSEYIEENVALFTASPFSFSAWVFLDTSTVNDYCIFQIGNKDASDDYWRMSYVPGSTLRYFKSSLAGQAVTSTNVTEQTWEHAGCVQADSNDRSVYLNGGNKGTNSDNGEVSAADRTSIGQEGDSTPGDFWDGRMAEVAFWNVALTDAEMAILGKGYSPLFVRPASLVSYFPLIRNSKDLLGGTNMTEFNTPTIGVHPRIIYPPPPQIRKYTTSSIASLGNFIDAGWTV